MNQTMRTVLYLLGLSAVCAFLVVALMLTAPNKAHAADWNNDDFVWDIYRVRPTRHHHRPVRYYREPEARNFEIDADRHEDKRCLDHAIDTVSTEHTDPADAMISATKEWASRVQWYFGSRWMNWDNAEEKKVVCDQSNAMDTLSGRIIDNAQKMLGNEGKNVRCVIRAIPCAQPMQRAEERRQ